MPQCSQRIRTSLLVGVAVLVLVSAAVSSAAGVAVTVQATPAEAQMETSTASGGYAQQTTPVNNSTLRHRNPDEVSSENRLAELQGVLGSRLAGRLSESSVQLSQAQYDRARSVLGEEYLDQLGKYGDVAGERGDDDATSATETFNETRTTQEEYSRTVQEFRETVDEYEEARANGNDARARQLAREAVDLGSQAARQASRLNESYGRLERSSGVDLDVARTRIQSTQAAIDTNRTDIAEAEFVSTTLTVRAEDSRGSFTDPFELTGTLESEDGPVGDRRIRLQIGPRTTTTTTNASGDFSLTYRPVVVPANASTLAVQYVPQDASVYSASNATLSVQIQQVTAQASITEATAETAFGDPVSARGSLAVDGEPVPGLPLAVGVDETRVVTGRTGPNGSFALTGTLPATPPPGDRTVAVTAVTDERAVAVAPADTDILVQETPTNLSATVDGSPSAGDPISVVGTLTAAGQPVPDQRVAVTVAGERVGTARTDAQGTYELRLTGETGVATVRFGDAGTNLAPDEASVQLPSEVDETETAAAGESGADTGSSASGVGGRLLQLLSDPLAALTSPIGLVLGSLVLGVAGLAVAVLARRRSDAASTTTTATSSQSVTGDGQPSAGDTTPSTQPESAPPDPFAGAMGALERGTTDDAIIDAYAVIRQAFAASVSERARTHWQFFDACVANGVDAEPLRTITEAYETARYGTNTTDNSAAERAIEAARSLVDTAGSDDTLPDDD